MHNWNLRHIYKIRFLIFWGIFCAFGFKVFRKCDYDPKNFLVKKSRKISKNEFNADFKSIEKVVKKCTKKVISKTNLMNMSKSENSAYFHHVFAKNFILVHFFKNFSKDSKSVWNSAFFYTHIEFWINNFLHSLALFANFDCKCTWNGSKKLKIFFMNVS